MTSATKLSLAHERLSGRRILVVEDDWYLAIELKSLLELHGATVIGPVGTLDGALDLIDCTSSIDDAILDIKLHDATVFAAAEKLEDRDVRIIFFSAFGEEMLTSRFAHYAICPKPTDNIVRLLMH